MKLVRHGRITGRARQAYERAREQRRWDERRLEEFLFDDEDVESARVVPVIHGNERLAEMSSIPVPALDATDAAVPVRRDPLALRPAATEPPERSPAAVLDRRQVATLSRRQAVGPVRAVTPLGRPSAPRKEPEAVRLIVAAAGGIAAGLALFALLQWLVL